MNFGQRGRKCLIIFLLSTLLSAHLYSQYQSDNKDAPPLSERIFFGGNFSLQLGTYSYIDLSPTIGIWVLPRLAVATGPSFKYINNPYGSTDAYGGKGFTRFVLIQELDKLIPLGLRMSLYMHGEYEIMSYRSEYFFNSYENNRFTQDFVFAGVGISQYFGLRSSVNISVLWILNDYEIQVYDSPELRFGFTF